jgi:2-C-methyl-D-erythritol 2,4-cyclodiphosphate synthase
MSFRVGLGHDTHRLIAGRPLILGGVRVEHDKGLDGHSDADVLLHAITDALLGAAALGDIGDLFPNTDAQWANADSAIFVKAALSKLSELGWQIVKLSALKSIIAARVAELLGLDRCQVNVKAKTGEKVGPIGRQEAISADAVVLIEKR